MEADQQQPDSIPRTVDATVTQAASKVVADQKQTDSIPRAGLSQVFRVLAHLARTEDTTTFDQVRQFLVKKSARPAPSSRTAMWTVARDALVELQKLGFLEAGVLPRTQSVAKKNADTPCKLTESGRALAALYQSSEGRAYDQMLLTWLNQHPYFRTFVARLHQSPIYVPDVTSAKQLGSSREENVAERVSSHCLKRLESTGFPAEKADVFRTAVAERIQELNTSTRLSELDAKKWVDTIQDRVVLPSFLQAEQLPFDAVTFQHVLNAAKFFLAASWTNSHPLINARAIFPTCGFIPDVRGQEPITAIHHHGKAFAKARFVTELRDAYGQIEKSAGGYASAYEIRALVCIALQMPPRTFTMCLQDLIDSPIPGLTIYPDLPFDPPPAGEEYIEVNRDRIGILKLTTS